VSWSDRLLAAARALAAPEPPQAARRGDAAFDPNNPAAQSGYSNPGSGALYNPFTGQGVAGMDARVYDRWRPARRLGVTEVEAIRVDGIGGRLLQLFGREATREGFRVVAPRSDLGAEETAQVLRYLQARGDQLDVRGALRRWDEARWAWGWALLQAGPCGSPADWSAPLGDAGDPEVRWLTVWERRGGEVRVGDYGLPEEAEFRRPRWYNLAAAWRPELQDDEADGLGSLATDPVLSREVRLDASRCRRLATATGRSHLDGVADRLAEVLAAARGTAELARRPAIPWIQSNTMGAQLRRDADATKRHYSGEWGAASDSSPLLLDALEAIGYASASGTLSSSDPIFGLGYLLCAAWGVPMTLAFGSGPKGFSSGDSEDRDWTNRVRTIQAELEVGALWVFRLLLRELAAKIAATDPALAARVATLDLAIVWQPLRVLTAEEQALYLKTSAEYFGLLLDAGIVSKGEVRQSALGGDDFTTDIALVAELDPTAQEPEDEDSETAPGSEGVEGEDEPAPQTWTSPEDAAVKTGASAGYVRRLVAAGAVKVRRRTGARGSHQVLLEDVREALAAAEVAREGSEEKSDEGA
jgi:hypothetical protein